MRRNDTIQLADSNNNVVANNIADDNAGGIIISTFTTGSHNNEIHGNTTNNNNTANGLWIWFWSIANSVTENYSFANLPFDMEDDNPGCGTNKVERQPFWQSQPVVHPIREGR